MTERTYSRTDVEMARAAWAEFGDEWREPRRVAGQRGMLYPPSGTRWDSREDESPSQRAIVYAALQDRPKGTLAIIGRSRSWSQVVRAIVADESRLREGADLAERDATREREHQPTRSQAIEAIRGVLGRLR